MKPKPVIKWGFSIDDIGLDGYSTETHLNMLLDFLAEEKVVATLFAVPRSDGKRLDRRPGYISILKDALQRGHEVAQHGLDHDRFEVGIPPEMILRLPHEGPARKYLAENEDKLAAAQTVDKIRQKLREGRRIIEDATGGPVAGFRAPALQTCANLFKALAEENYAYDSSTCLQPAAWSILNKLKYTPSKITRSVFDQLQKPGLRELPLTAEYTWYLEQAKFDETYALAIHDFDACCQSGIPVINICHVSPIQEGPDPTLGFEFYRRYLQYGRDSASRNGVALEYKTLKEIAESMPAYQPLMAKSKPINCMG